MSGEAVPKGVRVDTLLESGAASSLFDRKKDALGAHWHVGGMGTSSAGKQEVFRLRIRRSPVAAQFLKEPGTEHDVAVFIALTLMDVDDHACAVYIAAFQLHEFFAPHACSVKGSQPDPMETVIGGVNE